MEYDVSSNIHGGPDRLAPRFAGNDQVLLTVAGYHLVLRLATTGKLLRSHAVPGGQNNWTAFAVAPAGNHVATAVWEGDGFFGMPE